MVMETTAQVECAIKGDEWTVIFTGPKNKTRTFKLGQEFEDDALDGQKVKVCVIIICTVHLLNKQNLFNF